MSRIPLSCRTSGVCIAQQAGGGVPGPDPAADLAGWGHALQVPTARGLVVGRALLYPPDGEVFASVDAAAAVLRAAGQEAGERT